MSEVLNYRQTYTEYVFCEYTYYIYKSLSPQNDLRIHNENFKISSEVCLINNNNYSLLL